MKSDDGRVDALRALAKAETCDDAWLVQVSKELGLPIVELRKKKWQPALWADRWGKAELEEVDEGVPCAVWERTDGAPLMAVVGDTEVAAMLRAALLGELICELKSQGKVSYARAGAVPANWNKIKVYLDGAEVQEVTTADAALGKLTMYKRDGKGKPIVMSGELVELEIYGNVALIVDDQNQSFF